MPDAHQFSTDSGYISLVTGGRFYLDDPYFNIYDIAWSLAKTARFRGHTSQESSRYEGMRLTESFYSVADHCVEVSYLVPEHVAMEALMHDAHEAYVGDIPAPLKQYLPDFVELEKRLESELARHYSLRYPWPSEVKEADWIQLYQEAKVFVRPEEYITWPTATEYLIKAGDITEFFSSFEDSAQRFLLRFDELNKARGGLHYDE